MEQKCPAGRGRPPELQEECGEVAVWAGPYLQLEPDLVTSLDTGQAQLPTMYPQEHSMGLNRQHIYLLWGRAEQRVSLQRAGGSGWGEPGFPLTEPRS